MGSQDGHSEQGHDHQQQAPTLIRSDSITSTAASTEEFAEASEGIAGDQSIAVQPQRTTTSAEKDNATLAALAASSSSSLPISPSSDDLIIDDNSNSPSFILVASLRSQITDLTSQVTSLNSKLVRSYNQVGDLEDELEERRQGERRAKEMVKKLEEDKEKWEREIERGGWVERDHVSAEMQRLMSQVLSSNASRLTALEAHSQLETEIDTLTSSLFSEANNLVVVERVARARAEEKMRSLEAAGEDLKGVFEEVQKGLRDAVERLESKEVEVEECRRRMREAGVPLPEEPEEPKPKLDSVVAFSDGTEVIPLPSAALSTSGHQDPFNPPASPSQLAPPRLLTTVLPYHEFLSFIHHLRQLRLSVLSRPVEHPAYPHPYTSTTSSLAHRGFGAIPSPQSTVVTPTTLISPPSPAQLLAPHLLLSTHLSQPFLKRCIEEDSDPTLRLDLAPGLGFLSRRTVGTAIVDGTLLIEPFFSGGGGGAELPSDKCALCGTGLDRWARGASVQKSTVAEKAGAGVNSTMRKVLGGGGWGLNFSSSSSSSSTSTSNSNSTAKSEPSSPTKSTFPLPSYSHPPPAHEHIHIVRTSDSATSTRYAVCPTYCLRRLRAVCEFWTYVRVIERGLLLEEGFRFVKGRGAAEGGSASARQSVEGLGLSGEKVVVGDGGAGGWGSGGQGGRRESLQLNAGKGVDDEFVLKSGGELEVANEEEDEEEDADVKNSKSEAEEPKVIVEPAAAAESKEKEETAVEPEEKPINTDDKSPSTSPNLSKPPIPRRSAARASGSTTPVLGSQPSPPSSPVVPSSSTDFAPPQLPPRRNGLAPPRHPSTSASDLSNGAGAAGGAEIVGTAMGWEDRCWTEVIRLKESVFWARVAAVAGAGGEGGDGPEEGVVSRLVRVEGH